MFNMVMGIIMVGIGIVCMICGIVGDVSAPLIFFGCLMLGFGIVEIIRGKKSRERVKDRKNNEMDAYLKIASEMGVVVNPITKEIVSKNDKTDAEETSAESEKTE